jgi:2-amino-4-hydroxy-6-hydroxymethyldihydropteridine diphosphokinase
MRAGIALGSNLGDRGSHLRSAIAAIREFAKPPILLSRVYETEPVDCPPGSPVFLNAAVEIDYAGDVYRLMEHLQAIERNLGRPIVRGRNTPRTVDLDLLYADDQTIESPSLILPHPGLLSRAFVLLPLCDIVPDRKLPGDSKTFSEHANMFSNSNSIKCVTVTLQ